MTVSRLRFRKPSPIVALAVAGAFVVLCALGAWQLRRLTWKEQVIGDIQSNLAAEPGPLPPEGQVREFLHVKLDGTYSGQELYFGGKYHRQQLGYHVYAPLKLEDGRSVLVNRGWIDTKEREDAEAKAARGATGPASVVGIVRTAKPHRWFLPKNAPERNMWFWHDMPALSQAVGAPLGNYYVEQIAGPFAEKTRPIALTGEVDIPNDHLQYALTWFGLAASLVVMFGFAHVRRDAGV